MPIYSMTGFARAQVRVTDQLAYTLSVKSVNHRFLDIQLRLPAGFDALEMEMRRVLKESLVRGHVELTLSVDRTTQQKAGYNRELVAAYIDAFRQARGAFRLKGDPDLNVALRMPGALQAEVRGNLDEDIAVLSESATREIGPLLQELKVMRAREGEALEANLRAGLDRLAEAVAGVAALRPEVEQRYQERLTQRLVAATGNEFNRQRLLEEVAVLVDHSDISEELERMVTRWPDDEVVRALHAIALYRAGRPARAAAACRDAIRAAQSHGLDSPRLQALQRDVLNGTLPGFGLPHTPWGS